MRLFSNNARRLGLAAAAVVLCAAPLWAQAGARKDGNFKASDGINIHYITQGESGPWVVLIHGFSDSGQRMWFTTGIAPELAKNHRVVAIDNRNHGRSDKPSPGGSGRWQDVLELMDHLKIDKAHIQGYSMGGGFTAQLLANHPEKFITAGFGGSGIQETDPELRAKAVAQDAANADPEEAARENQRWDVILRNNPRGGRAAAGGDAKGGAAKGAGRGMAGRGARGGRGDMSILAPVDRPPTSGDAAKAATPPATPAAAPPAATAGAAPAPATPAATPPAADAALAPARGGRGGGGGGMGGPRIDLSKITFPVMAVNGDLDSPHAKTNRMQRELKNFKNTIVPGKTHLTLIGVGGAVSPEMVKAVVDFVNANDPK